VPICRAVRRGWRAGQRLKTCSIMAKADRCGSIPAYGDFVARLTIPPRLAGTAVRIALHRNARIFPKLGNLNLFRF